MASFHRLSCPTRNIARPGYAAEEQRAGTLGSCLFFPARLVLVLAQGGHLQLLWLSNPFFPYKLFRHAGCSDSPGIPALARLRQEDCCEFETTYSLRLQTLLCPYSF